MNPIDLLVNISRALQFVDEKVFTIVGFAGF
jgi:hypothetical protein